MATVPHASLTAANLHEPKGIDNAGPNQVYVSDGSGSGSWIDFTALVPTVSGVAPVGLVADFAGAVAPSGWLLCYGQNISRTTYSTLFNVLGTTYGPGNGTTTFTLPDFRGRISVGRDNMGGSAANRVTSGGSGITGTDLGASGGSQSVTLTTAQMPSHSHAAGSLSASSAGNHTHSVSPMATATRATGSSSAREYVSTSGGSLSTSSAGAHTHNISGSTGSQGSGSAHNNMPPVLIVSKIIYTGVF